jgi:aerobic carbon-monoxide dehydrogenase large subunit
MTRVRIGDSLRRSEDTRFLTGHGQYIDDLPFKDLAHAFVLRSPHSHARIVATNTKEAARLPGVQAILMGADQEAAGIVPMEPNVTENFRNGEPFTYIPQPPLAIDDVRYVGQPVALVVARTLDQARDAAELIEVDYDPLSAVTTTEAALRDDGNVVLRWDVGDPTTTDGAFQGAAHTVKLALQNHRIITNSIEPRGCVGHYDAKGDGYTLHVSGQQVHMGRDTVAATLGVEADRVRVIAPDVGGGFGVKNIPYGEYVLMLWAARVAGCPVKWINERSDGFISDHQARDHLADAELALDGDGKFLALRVASWANLGAYLCGASGRVCTDQYAALPNSIYKIPNVRLTIGAVVTNTVPVGVTRGPGFAEAINIIERLIDRAALEMNIDRAELRRRNMVTSVPFISPTGTPVDSGQFSDNLDAAIRRTDGFESRRKESEARGLLRGFGFAYHIKGTGGPPEENVELTFGEDDTVTLTTGTQSIGQGHETSFPQIISDFLGVPFECIRYRHGDTGLISKGGGHGSSRATYMGGTAIFLAIEKIIKKGLPLAANALEAAEADISFADGDYRVTGTDLTIDIRSVARIARDSGMRSETGDVGLDTPQEFVREFKTFPNGCHVAEVEIDPDTGKTSVVRYTAVDDYGVMVNPVLVSGQVHGAIAQGIGQALMEEAVYDDVTGQLISGSLMEYALPRADDLPAFDIVFNGVPCTTNPLGVKGCGEAGAIAAYPAVSNAIIDALAPYNVTGFDGPATPERIWRLIHQSKGA